ncbi:hypothetical protein G6M26_27340 [Agrobacterium tumefaciens]|nr:hypothetical protein [Agrobacterium tumefaciens]NTE22270.1 hypothetical protein [Agrobacterium tumefaciens]
MLLIISFSGVVKSNRYFMKKKLLSLLTVMLVTGFSAVFAQAPQQFNYQGALRNADGSVVANKNISLRLSILNGSDQGVVQYTEVRNLTTTSLGMYNVAIGGTGAVSSSNNFPAINWGAGLKYLKVEVDLNGGNNFISAGTTQLLSVPYALYAANATAGADGKSAYQIWLDSGNTGSQADFLNSLKMTGQGVNGDLAGTFPSPSVIKIQGVSISAIAPTAGQVLQFDGAKWVPTALPASTGADVVTSQPDIIALSNSSGAALKNLGISIKPGTAGSILMTDGNQQIKWQSAGESGLVKGKIAEVSFNALDNGTTQIPANDVAKAKITVPGAQVGNSVFLSNAADETEYSIITSWVSAPNEVSIRLANYQPIPVDITGRQYKLLLIQN